MVITHLDGCDQEVELFNYFKEEMNLEFKFCLGVQEIASHTNNCSCFGVIMDSQPWCLIVSIDPSLNNKTRL